MADLTSTPCYEVRPAQRGARHTVTTPAALLCCRCVPAVFVSPSLIAQTDASVEETLRNGSWLDVATVLPLSLGPSDVGQLLDKSAEISRDTEHKKGQVGKRGACTGTGAPMSCTWLQPRAPLLLCVHRARR